MWWFRAKRGGIAWLGLLALVCQFYVSFGHVHLTKFGGSITWAIAADGGDASARVLPPSPLKSPGDLPSDYCDICASLAMSGTLVVPVPPAIVAPVSFVEPLPWSVATIAMDAFDRTLFDARGPPQA
jgi:hypothetical protein